MENIDLIKQHDEGTVYCSFPGHMREVSPTYNQIIEKGHDIVPDILNYLRDNDGGMNIILLLTDILKISPYKPEQVKSKNGESTGFVGFDVGEAAQAWINWGIENNLISSNICGKETN